MVLNFRQVATRLIKPSASPIIVGLLLLPASLTAAALETFDARYQAYRHGRELGHASLSLEALGRDKYRLTYHSKVSLFFLSDERKEVSLFSLQDGEITPYKYQYERTGTGSDKSLNVEFDAETNTIKFADKKPLPWHGELDNQLYRIDVQRKLAQGAEQFAYTLLNYRGEIRDYELQVLGTEQLELPYGMVEGVKVKIMRDNNRRETYAWFSPALGYQLVRLQQFKDGEEQGDIRLSEFRSELPSQTASQ